MTSRADPDDVTVVQVRGHDPTAVQERAVGAPVVKQPRVTAVTDDDGVGARHAPIVEPHVRGQAAAEVGDRRFERKQLCVLAVVKGEVGPGRGNPVRNRPALGTMVEQTRTNRESARPRRRAAARCLVWSGR